MTTEPMAARVLLATHNAHKVRELREIIAADPRAAHVDLHQVIGLGDLDEATVRSADVVESGVTFAENALIKARAAAAVTGIAALADDSGLAVDVLGGSPGVFSARWAGAHGDDEANLRLLLAQIADVPDEHRSARFVCAMALVLPDGTEVVREGTMPGRLTREPRGQNGFGYDPILQPEGEQRTSAELSPAEKNAISHRAAATRAILSDVLAALNDRPSESGEIRA